MKTTALFMSAAVLFASCSGGGLPFASPNVSVNVAVDCGFADQRLIEFARTGRTCLWNAYSSGQSARWSMTRMTMEGDPIPYTVTLSDSIEVTQDTTADKHGGPNRGRTTWRCSAMTQVAHYAEGSFLFTFSGCTGAGFSPPSL